MLLSDDFFTYNARENPSS